MIAGQSVSMTHTPGIGANVGVVWLKMAVVASWPGMIVMCRHRVLVMLLALWSMISIPASAKQAIVEMGSKMAPDVPVSVV